MKRIQVYGFEASTGKYEGLEYAYEDPLEPGNYMMPANSTTHPPPSISDNEYPSWDGKKWNVIKIETPKEPEDIKPTKEELWDHFRKERNYRIRQTDYLFLADAPPMSSEKKRLWKEYRQSLRDLPSRTLDPENPVWPIQPK